MVEEVVKKFAESLGGGTGSESVVRGYIKELWIYLESCKFVFV